MSQTALIVAAIIIVALIGAGVLFMQRRRSEHLQSRFGPEYERTVDQAGSRRKAESELADREKRVEKFHIRQLDPATRRGFMERWAEVQARFVEDPPRAVMFADALLAEVMTARGYPVKDFEQRASDISVNYPSVVEHYRTAHEIAVRESRGEASTEDLRRAMIHYRALFEELVREEMPAEREPEPAH